MYCTCSTGTFKAGLNLTKFSIQNNPQDKNILSWLGDRHFLCALTRINSYSAFTAYSSSTSATLCANFTCKDILVTMMIPWYEIKVKLNRRDGVVVRAFASQSVD